MTGLVVGVIGMQIKFKAEDGFTLLELMLVLVIAGLLASVAIPQVYAYRQRSREAQIESKLDECRRGGGGPLRERECAERKRRLRVTQGYNKTGALPAQVKVMRETAEASAVFGQGLRRLDLLLDVS
jgi:prepilin-type N-terminal cleavage/methylation domain-containing protein